MLLIVGITIMTSLFAGVHLPIEVSAQSNQSEVNNGTNGNVEGTDGCDPSYPDVCIAPPPPDLNCDDVPNDDIRVVGDDPHGLDGDSDGIGCES
jgi:hypothetical protein